MMKRLTLLMMWLASFMSLHAQITIDEVNFPDSYFRRWITEQFDKNEDLLLSEGEIAAVTKLDNDFINYGYTLSSMKGVEFFYNLQKLKIHSDSYFMSELDLSKNPNLKSIELTIPNLSLLVLNAPLLDSLSISTPCKISNLDLKISTELVYLKYFGSDNMMNLKSLDLSQNTKLKYVELQAPDLLSLSLNAPLLDTLKIASCKINSLNLSASTELSYLKCSDCKLNALDLRNCKKLKTLLCRNNSIAALNLSDSVDIVEFDAVNQTLEIFPVNGCFDMSIIPEFDITKTSNWKGAQIVKNVIVVNGVNQIGETATVYYTYKTGATKGLAQEITVSLSCLNQNLPYLLSSIGYGETSSEPIDVRKFYDADGDRMKEFYKIDSSFASTQIM